MALSRVLFSPAAAVFHLTVCLVLTKTFLGVEKLDANARGHKYIVRQNSENLVSFEILHLINISHKCFKSFLSCKLLSRKMCFLYKLKIKKRTGQTR